LEVARRMKPHVARALVNHQAGLLGVSGLSPDMKTLLEQRQREPHAAQADMLSVKGATRALPAGYMECHMGSVRLIICIALLTGLLSTSLVACAINTPPVKSLQQWEQERNRTRSRE
jgi:hypothetical protein